MVKGYEILQEIGSGGMARVYLAEQTSIERLVALKILKPEFCTGEEFKKRFLREAKIAANAVHTNLVTIHDFGESDGLLFLVMEYLGGETLKQAMASRIKTERKFSIFRQIAEGLGAIHKSGMVHRDLKPENIVFRDTEGTEPVITDFGIARSIDDSMQLTQIDIVVGTPMYMSPEQVEYSNVGPCSDLYSFGLIFYEALVGERPYKKSIVKFPGHKERKSVPELPVEFRDYQPLFNGLLAYYPDQRFQSVTEMMALWREIDEKANKKRTLLDRYPSMRGLSWIRLGSYCLAFSIISIISLNSFHFLFSILNDEDIAEAPNAKPEIDIANAPAIEIIIPNRMALCWTSKPWMLPSKVADPGSDAIECGVIAVQPEKDINVVLLKEDMQGNITLLADMKCPAQMKTDTVTYLPSVVQDLDLASVVDFTKIERIHLLYTEPGDDTPLCDSIHGLLSQDRPIDHIPATINHYAIRLENLAQNQ